MANAKKIKIKSLMLSTDTEEPQVKTVLNQSDIGASETTNVPGPKNILFFRIRIKATVHNIYNCTVEIKIIKLLDKLYNFEF